MGDVPVDIIASVSTQMELLQGEAAGLQNRLATLQDEEDPSHQERC